MLPSGNDAATVLAEHFGQYLYEVATRYKNNSKKQGPGQIMSSLHGKNKEDHGIKTNWE